MIKQNKKITAGEQANQDSKFHCELDTTISIRWQIWGRLQRPSFIGANIIAIKKLRPLGISAELLTEKHIGFLFDPLLVVRHVSPLTRL